MRSLVELPDGQTITLHETARYGGLNFNAVPQDRLLPGVLFDASINKLARYGNVSQGVNRKLGLKGVAGTTVEAGQRFVNQLNKGIAAYNRGIFEGPASRLQVSFLETYGQDLAEALYRQGYNKIQITQTLAEHARLFSSSQTAWSSVLNSPGRIAAGSLVLFSSEPEAFLRMFFGALFGAPRYGAVGATRVTSEIFNRVPLPDRLKFLRNRVEPNGSEIWTQVAIAMFVGTAALAQGIQSLSSAICGVSPVLAPGKLLPITRDPFSRIGIGYNRDWLSPETCFQSVNGPATIDLVSPWDAGFRLLKPWDFVTGRVSVPVRVGHDLVADENFYGEEFQSDTERTLHTHYRRACYQ